MQIEPGSLPGSVAFERENRHWFEQWVPPRPDSYKHYDRFCTQCDTLRDDMTQGTGFYALGIIDDVIIGRFNLSPIIDRTGDIGYRIGQQHTGQGYSILFGRLLVASARNNGLSALTARVLEHNPASQKTLTHLGFQRAPAPDETVTLNGACHRLKRYELAL